MMRKAMCHDASYEEFPAITLGGPTGDYFVQCPTTSCQWAEYAIDCVVNGDVGTSALVISGNRPPKALDYTGIAANTFSDDALLHAWPIRIPATTTTHVNSSYERIINSQRRVFVRIDAGASNSTYVTIRFRIKVLPVVPGPSHTVHPDHAHALNQAREETTKQRLKQAGIPGYAEE